MDKSSVENSIVRIIRISDQQWVGCGFYAKFGDLSVPPLVVTCAHVVADAIGDPAVAEQASRPSGTFRIDFPNSLQNRQIECNVVDAKNAWHPATSTLSDHSRPFDIAFLQPPSLEIPSDVKPIDIKVDCTFASGQNLNAFGGAEEGNLVDDEFGEWVCGKQVRRMHGRFQFKSNPSETLNVVREGFSGTPIIIEKNDDVIGMVTVADEGKGLAWFLPVQTLFEAINGGPVEEAEDITVDPRNFSLDDVPIDLHPPFVETYFKRKSVQETIEAKFDNFLSIGIYGGTDSGKTGETSIFVQRLVESEQRPCVWFVCSETSSITELIEVVSEVLGEHCGEKPTFRHLLRALHQTNLLLIVDQINAVSERNRQGFFSLLDLCRNRKSTTSLIFILSDDHSTYKDDASTVCLSAMSREEVVEIISQEAGLPVEDVQDALYADRYSCSEVSLLLQRIVEDPSRIHEIAKENVALNDTISSEFKPEERAVLTALAMTDQYVDNDFFRRVCETIGVQDWEDLQNRLFGFGLLRTAGTRRIFVTNFVRERIRSSTPTVSQKQADKILGTVWLEKHKEQDQDETPKFDISSDDMIYLAIRHFQRSMSAEQMVESLINEHRWNLARAGHHRYLVAILDYEFKTKRRMPIWSQYQYVQSLVATGEITSAFSTMKRICSILLTSRNLKPDSLMQLCTRFSDVLQNARHYDLAQELLETALQEIDNSQLQASTLRIATSHLLWSKIHCEPKIEIAHELISLREEALLARNDLAVAIESTRLGVLYLNLKMADEAATELLQAVRFFQHTDQRGLIWSLGHYSVALVRSDPLNVPLDELEWLCECIQKFDLLSEETYEYFRLFEELLHGEELQERVASVKETALEASNNRELREEDLEFVLALQEFLKENGLDEQAKKRQGTADTDNVRGKTSFLHSAQFKMGSQANKSFVRNLVSRDPEGVASDLFGRYSLQRIFHTPILSSVLVACCKRSRNEELIDSYVVSNLSVILSSRDDVKLFFARFLEQVKKDAECEELLESVGKKSGFNFYNVSANLYSRKSFETALDYNQKALAASAKASQRARVNNNIAVLILENGKSDLLAKANLHIQDSLKEKYRGFNWPNRTKLAIDVNFAESQELNQIVAGYFERSGDDQRTVKYTSRLIIDPDRRIEFLSACDAILD
jgi:hypothetical protein